MDALTTSANAQVDDFASQFDRGEIQFYDASDTKIGWSQLRAPAFEPALNAKAEAKGLPHDIFVESSGVDAQIDYAVLTSPDGKRERLSVSTSGGGGDVVVSGLQIQDGGTTQTVEAFSIQRGDVDPSLDDPGTIELTLPTGGETYTEGGVGNWQAEIDLEDLRVKRVELEESTDGGSTWTKKDTIYYTKDPTRTDTEREKGPREHPEVGWQDTYEEGVWTVDASATHVRAVMVDENGGRTTSSAVSISTEAPAATFATLSDLLAADPTTFSVGDTVIVEDQEAHGQEFVLSESGEPTDHCTTYVADADTSAEQSENFEVTDGNSLANSDVVAGSLEVKYGTSGDEWVDGIEMDGFGVQGQFDKPFFDFAAGEFLTHQDRLKTLRDNSSNPTSGGHVITYKYATSDRRWKRQHHGHIDVRWAGAEVGTETQAVWENNAKAYNWCVIAAREWRKKHDRRWAFVGVPGVLNHIFSRAAADGVIPIGTGPEIDVPEADWPVRGAFRLPDGKGLWMNDTTHTNTRRERNSVQFRSQKWGTYPGNLGAGLNDPNTLADKVGVGRFLKYDGNVANNTDPFNNADYTDVANTLQNGRNWTAIAGQHTPQVSNYVKHGCQYAAQYVHVTKVGSDQFQPRTGDWSLSHDILLSGGGVGDHPIYSLPNDEENALTNLTFTGFNSIGAGYQLYQCNHENVTIKDLEANPARTDGFTGTFDLVNHRGNNGTFPDNAPTDHRQGDGINIKNLTLDVRGAPSNPTSTDYALFALFTARTFSATVENLVVFTCGNGERYVLLNDLKGSENVNIKNVTVVVDPNDKFQVLGSGQEYGVVDMEGFEVKKIDPTQSQEVVFGEWNNINSTRAAWLRIKNSDFEIDFGSTNTSGEVKTMVQSGSDTGLGLDLIFDDCTLNNIGDTLGEGYYYDCDIQTYGDGNTDSTPMTAPMRDVTDQDGRTSDDSGVYTTGASEEGQNFVRIKTDMLWTPQEINAEVIDGDVTVTGTSYVQSDGSSVNTDDPRSEYVEVSLSDVIPTDASITISWDAHKTPLSDFAADGAFVANDPQDESMVENDPDITKDMRGLVTSIESPLEPNWSATSSDSGTVSVSMDNDYTIRLTDEGNASKTNVTITAKATIRGVGEIETTFDVAYTPAPTTTVGRAAQILSAHRRYESFHGDNPVRAYDASDKSGSSQDIGYASGDFDQTAFENFIGSGDGWVEFYNVVEDNLITTSSPPKLGNSGSTITNENGNPSAQGQSAVTVSRSDVPSFSFALFVDTDNIPNGSNRDIIKTNGRLREKSGDILWSFNTNFQEPLIISNYSGTYHILARYDDGTDTMEFFVDNSSVASFTPNDTGVSFFDVFYADTGVSEVIFWSEYLDDTQVNNAYNEMTA